jgi:hypothetical protein
VRISRCIEGMYGFEEDLITLYTVIVIELLYQEVNNRQDEFANCLVKGHTMINRAQGKNSKRSRIREGE